MVAPFPDDPLVACLRGDGSSAVASKRAWSSIKVTASPEHGTTSFAALVVVTAAANGWAQTRIGRSRVGLNGGG
jgi:hypothetical protein